MKDMQERNKRIISTTIVYCLIVYGGILLSAFNYVATRNQPISSTEIFGPSTRLFLGIFGSLVFGYLYQLGQILFFHTSKWIKIGIIEYIHIIGVIIISLSIIFIYSSGYNSGIGGVDPNVIASRIGNYTFAAVCVNQIVYLGKLLFLVFRKTKTTL
jgi:hypothetical protein